MSQRCSPAKVLEDGCVSPPPGTVMETAIPTTFFDTIWLSLYLAQRLYFYEYPHPSSHFMQNALPRLKTSLSLTLQRFFPFAGNLRFPPPLQRPYIFFTDGDSIRFVVTESDADFNHLTSDHAHNAQDLQALVPNLPPSTTMETDDFKQLPLMAVQITIFPNTGFSIGIAFCHVAADGKAFTHFTKSWAAACKSLEDLKFLDNIPPPDHNRDSIQDPKGIWSFFVEQFRELNSDFSGHVINQTDKVRVTYRISRANVESLKKWIETTNDSESEQLRLSTFVVTCAYVWVCFIRVEEARESPSDDDDTICNFLFSAECRHRLKLPSEYFGNCLKPCILSAKRAELLGKNGILVAVKAIGRAVMELDKGPLGDADKWISRMREVLSKSKHNVVAVGSPKLLVYETDFGWGRPRKTEVAHIGSSGSFVLAENRDPEVGGVEIGFLFPPIQLPKFKSIFEDQRLNFNIS
ncbi:coumaroyl-CoA:anthocyanidin 3-O-glucoside-6''-O-coumaroyltransferase 1-like [Hibiscus syriacus]|nr:coumaroyl-CoA:anthocyanidin 3-O-glucoside-6''-O-coumaroyltransferase 1-like [Hibiscus syriacus]